MFNTMMNFQATPPPDCSTSPPLRYFSTTFKPASSCQLETFLDLSVLHQPRTCARASVSWLFAFACYESSLASAVLDTRASIFCIIHIPCYLARIAAAVTTHQNSPRRDSENVYVSIIIKNMIAVLANALLSADLDRDLMFP